MAVPIRQIALLVFQATLTGFAFSIGAQAASELAKRSGFQTPAKVEQVGGKKKDEDEDDLV